MILLLGSRDYITSALAAEFRSREYDVVRRDLADLDTRRFDHLFDLVRRLKPAFVISTGFSRDDIKPNCDTSRSAAVFANVLLPQQIAKVCVLTRTKWAHIIADPLYAGGKLSINGKLVAERNLEKPSVLKLLRQHPGALHGFTEQDQPNHQEAESTSGFIDQTQALADEVLRQYEGGYIWRCQNLFDDQNDPSNYLNQVRQAPLVSRSPVTLCHRSDFARACVELWQCRAPSGTYNIGNSGFTTPCAVKSRIETRLGTLRLEKPPQASARNLAGVLDETKMLCLGITMRTVEEALDDALGRWQPALKNFLPAPEQQNPSVWLPFSSPSPLQVQDWLRMA